MKILHQKIENYDFSRDNLLYQVFLHNISGNLLNILTLFASYHTYIILIFFYLNYF